VIAVEGDFHQHVGIRQEDGGDVAGCGALCDCNDDCTVATERCMDDGSGEFLTLFDRAGYCRPLGANETQADSIACN
jgi:hypothetical protein